MSLRTGAVVFFVLALVAGIPSPHNLFAADDAATAICNPIFGAETAAILTSFDAQKLDHIEACKAYAFLLERNGSGTEGVTPGCYRSQKDRILKLNPGFAVGLYRSLSEIEKLYGGKNIVQSGYRCSSVSHSSGCAADIIWTSCSQRYPGNTTAAWRCSSDSFEAPEQKWIDTHGKEDQYKIHLRFRYAPEGHHVEPTNTQGCIPGSMVTSAPSAPPPSMSPTSALANAARQAFGVQPQLPPQPMLPAQPLSMQQSPLNAFDLPSPTLLATSSGNGTATIATSSVADRLEELISRRDIATSSHGATATSVALIITGGDVGGIASTPPQNTQATTSGVGGSIAQNTFVSQDLSWQSSTPASESGIWYVLEMLKNILLQMLEYLKPFGGATHLDHEEEYSY